MTATRPAATMTDVERVFMTLILCNRFQKRGIISKHGRVSRKNFLFQNFRLHQRDQGLNQEIFGAPLCCRRSNHSLLGSIQLVNLHKCIACSVIRSAHNCCVCSCRQAKHNGRFKRIWRREPVLLNVDGVIIVLPVVIAGDLSSSRVVNCENGITERVTYPERTQRWAKGAHDDCRTSHVPYDKPANKQVVATGHKTT